MMTGPEHYKVAEELLETLSETSTPSPEDAWTLELAKLHVGLAQAAATVTAAQLAMIDEERVAWRGVLGGPPGV